MGSVVLKKLEKNYASEGRPPAVCGIDLEVRAGEFMVLVGPSGCGKSTTLRMIAGLEEATRGSIDIDGREVTHVPARDRDIAMVFQNYALYPHMTVRENMAFGLKMRGIDRKEIARRVDDAARLLGLDGVLERRPRELSGGQRQRVALGRAIVRQPKVFLFDEPLSNLDAKMRVATRLELARLHRRLGATMIYVTHDQVEAMTLGDRVCVMDAGRIKQVDTPLEVYRRPANLFVAGFIGSPAMNLWSGTAEPAGSGSVFRGPGGLRVPLGVHGLPADVTLGVRPEAVRLSSTEGVFEGVVEAVEATGAETFVTLEAGGATVVVRCGPDAPWRGGDRARVSFDEPGIHLFDTNSGRRLG